MTRPGRSSDGTQQPNCQLDALARELQKIGLQEPSGLREEFFAEVMLVVDGQIRQYTHPVIDRHELVNEFVVSVIEGLPSFRFDSPVERWLRVLLANAYHDVLRMNVGRSAMRAKIRKEAIQDHERHLVDAGAASAFDPVWIDSQVIWRAAVKLADDVQRRILRMRYGLEMPVTEIADELDLTENQVRYQLRLVLNAVRAKLHLKASHAG